MEFKRCNSDRTPANTSRSCHVSASGGTTPVRNMPPVRTPVSARSGASSARRTSATAATVTGSSRSARIDGTSPKIKGPGLPRPDAYKRSGTTTGTSQMNSSNGMSMVSSRSAFGDSPKAKRAAHKVATAKTGGNGRVNVYARVRAFSLSEAADSPQPAVYLTDNKVEVVVSPKNAYSFTLDGCFSSAGAASDKGFASQSSVFDTIGRPLAENALAGYNAAIMVYGQTGSGKTYTMFGPPDSLGTGEQGLVPRVCDMIFERAESCLQKGITYRVCVSMIEVYLEDVFDLFDSRKQVTVRKDYLDNSFHVIGAKSIPVRRYKDVEGLLRKAETLRTFAATAIHDRSSRAHALFQLELYTTFESADIAPRTAKILLADLAGCERIKLAQTETGIPFEEARNINLSLLSLGSCIEAVTTRKGTSHNIPEFRNSTLTKLLKEYLGGNSVSSIVVTVGPSARDARLSVQSLRFADRAMKVVTHAKINTIKPTNEHEGDDGSGEKAREEYNKRKEALEAEFQVQGEVQKLLSKITVLENQLMNSVDDEVVARLQEEISTYQKSLANADAEMQEQRRILYVSEVMLEEQLKELNTRMQEMVEEHEETMENLLVGCRKNHAEQLDRQQARHEEEVGALLKGHRSELDRLNALLRSSSAKCATLTTNLNDTKEELRKTDGLVDEMQMALEELGEVSKANETELQDYVELLRGENSRLNTMLETLRQQLEESEATVKDRDGRLEASAVSLETLRQQLEESEATVKDRDGRLEASAVSLETLRQQLEESEATVKDRDGRLEASAVSLETLRQQLEESEATVKDRDGRLEASAVSLETLRQQLEESEATVKDRDGRLEASAVSLETLRQQLEESEATVKDRDGRLEASAVSLETLRQQLEESEATVKDRDGRLEASAVSLETLRQQLEESEATVKDRDGRLEASAVSLETLRQQLEESEATVKDRDGRLEASAVSLETLRQQLEESEATVKDRDGRLEASAVSLETLRQQLEESEATVKDRDGRLEASAVSLETLRQQLEESEATVKDRDGRLEASAVSLETLRQQLEESEATVKDRDGRLEASAVSLETLRQQLEESEATVKDRDGRLEASAVSLETLRQQLEESEATVKDRDGRLEASAVSLETLRQQLEESEATVKDRDGRLEASAVSLETLRQQLEESEAEITILRRELEVLGEKVRIDEATTRRMVSKYEGELEKYFEDKSACSARIAGLQVDVRRASDYAVAMYRCVEGMEGRMYDTYGYMFESFSAKCEAITCSFMSLTEGVTGDLTRSTTERLRLLSEIVGLRSSVVATKATSQRRMSMVGALVQSARDIMSKIADEVEHADCGSEQVVMASFESSSVSKESWGVAGSPTVVESSLKC